MNNKTKTTRRRFLLLMGGTIGASALACGGLATFGARSPEVKLVEESFGDKTNMKDKILVAYASKCGSTGQVAKTIGQTLADTGATPSPDRRGFVALECGNYDKRHDDAGEQGKR